MRLRQVALVAADLSAAEDLIQERLGLSVCHRDPGVAAFGLINALFCAGDTFVEVVSPDQPDTTAGRYLERNGGDGGYMAIFQLPAQERAACVARAADAGIRTVWDGAIDGIAGTHFHPRDIGGAIVSVDTAEPEGSWMWAGSDWAEASGPGSLCGLTIADPEPLALAARWAQVLGGVLDTADTTATLRADRTELRFVPSSGRTGITEVDLCPRAEAALVDVCGVSFAVPPR